METEISAAQWVSVAQDIGATTAEKLEGISSGMDADPLPFLLPGYSTPVSPVPFPTTFPPLIPLTWSPWSPKLEGPRPTEGLYVFTQLYFTTKCDSKKTEQKQNLTKLN